MRRSFKWILGLAPVAIGSVGTAIYLTSENSISSLNEVNLNRKNVQIETRIAPLASSQDEKTNTKTELISSQKPDEIIREPKKIIVPDVVDISSKTNENKKPNSSEKQEKPPTIIGKIPAKNEKIQQKDGKNITKSKPDILIFLPPKISPKPKNIEKQAPLKTQKSEKIVIANENPDPVKPETRKTSLPTKQILLNVPKVEPEKKPETPNKPQVESQILGNEEIKSPEPKVDQSPSPTPQISPAPQADEEKEEEKQRVLREQEEKIRKENEEKERLKKEEEEKKLKEEQARKEKEEQAKKQKEEEEKLKREKEEQERLKKEEEDRKQKEKEERERQQREKEEAERKKREEQERIVREKEAERQRLEQERREKEAEEEKRRKQQIDSQNSRTSNSGTINSGGVGQTDEQVVDKIVEGITADFGNGHADKLLEKYQFTSPSQMQKFLDKLPIPKNSTQTGNLITFWEHSYAKFNQNIAHSPEVRNMWRSEIIKKLNLKTQGSFGGRIISQGNSGFGSWGYWGQRFP